MDDDTFQEFTIGIGAIMAGLEFLESQRFSHRKRVAQDTEQHHNEPLPKKSKTSEQFANRFAKLKKEPKQFISKYCMPPKVFDQLLQVVRLRLRCMSKDGIPAEDKLAMVLEFLASGDLDASANLYEISRQHFSFIVVIVCQTINSLLASHIPQWNVDNLEEVADGFVAECNFPHCVSALGGLIVTSEADFGDVKETHATMLTAACDAFYRFTRLDIGPSTSKEDYWPIIHSEFYSQLINSDYALPASEKLGKKKMPYYVVACDVFPLSKRVMRAFTECLTREQRIFNFRIRRVERCIETALGVMCARWRCLQTLSCAADRVRTIISACCHLHNFLMNTCRDTYCPEQFAGYEDTDGKWVTGEWEAICRKKICLLQDKIPQDRGLLADHQVSARFALAAYFHTDAGWDYFQDRNA